MCLDPVMLMWAPIMLQADQFCWPRSSPAPIMLQADRFCWLQSHQHPLCFRLTGSAGSRAHQHPLCFGLTGSAGSRAHQHPLCFGLTGSAGSRAHSSFLLTSSACMFYHRILICTCAGGHKLRLSGKEPSRQSDHSFLRVSFNNQFVPLYCLF